MKLKSILYGMVRPFVNPFLKFPTYVGFKQIAATTKALGGMLKPVFVPPKPTEKTAETFTETMERLNLTEEDIQKRKKEFRRLLLVYLFSGLLIFCYALYLAWQHSIHGSLACFVITLVAFTQVFRYHFWLFQLKQRKLGCTFRDWWNSSLVDGDK